jgi:hypothetical protein
MHNSSVVYLKMLFGRVAFAVCHTCRFYTPSPLAPWGHGSVPFDCCVRPGVGPTCGIQSACAHPHGEPVGELGVRRAGPVAMVKLAARNQSMVVVLILLQRAPWRASANWP